MKFFACADEMFRIDWSKQHCGTIATNINETCELMPDLADTLAHFHALTNAYNFLFDVKVHMLMPGQYPCIPNWHQDHVPRNCRGEKDYNQIDPSMKMYLAISGPPATEFFQNQIISPKRWYEFTQEDVHRGTQAKEFGWRGFIRATPKEIYPKSALKYSGLRRHSQVYLDSNNFTW